MQLVDLIRQNGGVASIARELGLDEQQAQRGVEALLPMILGGFEKQAQAGRADALGDQLSQLGGGGLADQVLSAEPTDPAAGNDLLATLFGSRDVSRSVAEHASHQAGVDPALLKRMLPLLTMLVSGYLAKRAGEAMRGGPPGSSSPSTPSTPSTPSAPGGGWGGVLNSILRGAKGGGLLGGLASVLDKDGNGNPLDDVLRRMGRQAG